MTKIWLPAAARPQLVGSPIDEAALEAVRTMLTEGCGDNSCNWVKPSETGRKFGTDSSCRCLGSRDAGEQGARLREVVLHLLNEKLG